MPVDHWLVPQDTFSVTYDLPSYFRPNGTIGQVQATRQMHQHQLFKR